MTCVANHESLFDLFDIAMLRLIPEPAKRPAKESPRVVTAVAASRASVSFVPERCAINEEDGDRWDGLS